MAPARVSKCGPRRWKIETRRAGSIMPPRYVNYDITVEIVFDAPRDHGLLAAASAAIKAAAEAAVTAIVPADVEVYVTIKDANLFL